VSAQFDALCRSPALLLIERLITGKMMKVLKTEAYQEILKTSSSNELNIN